MTTLFSETFEEGTNGTTITSSNSNLVIVAGAGWVFTNSSVPAGYGTMGARIAPTGSTAIGTTQTWASTPVTYHDMAWHETTLPAAATVVANFQNPSGVVADVQLTPTGQVKLRVNSVAVATSPALATAGTSARVDVKLDANAHTAQLRVFAGANILGATPDYDSGTITASAVAATTFANLGVITAATMSYVLGGYAVGTTAFPGPTGNIAPTANAGPDVTGIDPGTLVPLDGSGSSDPDGTVAGWSWRLVSKSDPSAPTPALSSTTAQKPTYTFPPYSGDVTYTWGLTVTDNSGAPSAEDTVAHSGLQASDFVLTADGWAPAYWTVLS